MLRKYFVPFLVLPFFISSCADSKKDNPESRGTLVKKDGKISVLSNENPDVVKKVCESAQCEPNYVYYASFGKRRNPPQNPPPVTPTPTPRPTPIPQPTPDPRVELQDYSRAILEVKKAWEKSEGSREIIVAVVDTGVDVRHPDLANNIWFNEQEMKGSAGVDDDKNGFVDDVYGWDFANNRANAFDDNLHGTHCAGIIGAEVNGIGTVGINQRVRIMPLKFLDSTGSGSTDAAIEAIDYAVANGAQVISNSWGGGGASSFLNEAIQKAISKGIYVVAAAGNEAANNDFTGSFPANFLGVISVGSSDENDQLSSFSNFGARSVFIAAPGSRIYSTFPGGSYGFLSGTSMATPQVAGALALALSVNKDLPMKQVKSLLCGSSSRILLDRVQCGRMNVGSFISEISLQ